MKIMGWIRIVKISDLFNTSIQAQQHLSKQHSKVV